jgi:hypothetical protein
MAKNDSLKDRRKYQRVLVEPSSKILTATVVDHGPTLMFDMSYEGAAFAQPKDKKIDNVDQILQLHLKTDIDEATIPARAVRVSQEVVAVHFEDISTEARIIIDRVVSDRIIGLNMSLIDPKHYSGKADYSHWFHGPKETNLYLWALGEKIHKAQMEMSEAVMLVNDEMLLFENKVVGDSKPLNNDQIARKVQAIIEQMDMDIPALHEFKKIVKDHVEN